MIYSLGFWHSPSAILCPTYQVVEGMTGKARTWCWHFDVAYWCHPFCSRRGARLTVRWMRFEVKVSDSQLSLAICSTLHVCHTSHSTWACDRMWFSWATYLKKCCLQFYSQIVHHGISPDFVIQVFFWECTGWYLVSHWDSNKLANWLMIRMVGPLYLMSQWNEYLFTMPWELQVSQLIGLLRINSLADKYFVELLGLFNHFSISGV